jgi:uncharacterized membrane protein YcaP (DUF421 family)
MPCSLPRSSAWCSCRWPRAPGRLWSSRFLIVALRVFGRRQTGQLTVIDLVVVLLLGSAVDTAMIRGDTTLPVGLTSAATLLVMNRVLSWVFLQSNRLSHLVNGGPVLLVHDGAVVEEHLRWAGMTCEDLAESLWARGYDSVERVRTAVLETDGTVSVVSTKGRSTER